MKLLKSYLARIFRKILNFLTFCYANMPYTIKNGKPIRMSFLVIQNIREDREFTKSDYRIPTFSGVNTHFDSFISFT